MKILGVSGKAGHGKDFFAAVVQDVMKTEFNALMGRWSLAHSLKANVYGEAHGALTFDEVWNIKPKQVRDRLQKRGSEEGRLVFGEEVWTLQTEAYLKLFDIGMPFMSAVVIPDIRFPNEVSFARLGGRPALFVEMDIRYQTMQDLGFTEEREAELLENNPLGLLEMEKAVEDLTSFRYAKELENSPGLCVRITSDRPTLTGEAALHMSETALDNLPESEFDYVVTNNLDTTVEDLREQARPIVAHLLSL